MGAQQNYGTWQPPLLDGLAEQQILDEMIAAAPAMLDAAFAATMEGARRALKRIRTALDAELWGSEMLGVMSLTGLEPAEVDACFLESIVPMAEQAASRESLAILRVMGVVGSPALRSVATAAADRVAARGVGEQRWVAKIGNPSVGDC